MLLRTSLRYFSSSSNVVAGSRVGQLNTQSTLNKCRSFYSTTNKKTETNNKDNKNEKNEKKEETNTNDNKDNKDKKEESKAKSILQTISGATFTGILITTTLGYSLYQFKKDITDEERYDLGKVESTILTHFAVPFREYFDNLFNNLREYPMFDAVFGPAEIHTILPPPLPSGLGREFTIVIDVDALSEISQRDKYPAIYKRAGYDYFLTNLSQHFEIILYSKEVQNSRSEQINFKLDPQQSYFSGLLYGDCGLKEKNRFSKHVEMLNRDPSKVILIDSAPQYDHPNVISVGRFKPNERDTTLIKLLPVLTDIGQKKVTDVRQPLQVFHSSEKDIAKSIDQYISANKSTVNVPTTQQKKK